MMLMLRQWCKPAKNGNFQQPQPFSSLSNDWPLWLPSQLAAAQLAPFHRQFWLATRADWVWGRQSADQKNTQKTHLQVTPPSLTALKESLPSRDRARRKKCVKERMVLYDLFAGLSIFISSSRPAMRMLSIDCSVRLTWQMALRMYVAAHTVCPLPGQRVTLCANR